MSPWVYLLLGVAAGGLLGVVMLLLSRRDRSGIESELVKKLELLDRAQERAERMLREEMSLGRDESAKAAKTQREELSASLEGVRGIVDLRLKQIQEDNSKQID